jgi:hypothetical protein
MRSSTRRASDCERYRSGFERGSDFLPTSFDVWVGSRVAGIFDVTD